VIVQAKTLLKLVADDRKTGYLFVVGVVSHSHEHRRHQSKRFAKLRRWQTDDVYIIIRE
jgi:hypothetical protein